MIMEQKIMFTQKSRELVTIGDEMQKSQMLNIATVNSQGVKDSKKTLEIIFNQSINEPTLLDFM